MRARSVVAVLVVLAVAAVMPLARAPPLPPYEPFGTASDEAGVPLPIGTALSAFIDGVEYSNASTVFAADGSYAMSVAGNSFAGAVSDTPTIKEGGNPGDPVVLVAGDFMASASVFREAGTWQAGTAPRLDLRAAVGAKQPGLLKIQSLVVRPADGGTQYAFVCNPAGGAGLDLSQFYLRKDVPGGYNGPTVALSGLVAAGATSYVDLGSAMFFVSTGDALKLVARNPGGVDAPNAGADVVVDRVEFNATSGGTLTWEPGNTIMTDAPAPGLAQQLRRSPQCADTNSGSDFGVVGEFPPGRLLPPGVNLQTPDGGEDWTGGSAHEVRYTIADSIDASLSVVIALSADGGLTYPTTIFGPTARSVGTQSFTWTVGSVDTSAARIRVCATNSRALTNCDASASNFEIDSTPPTILSVHPPSGATDVRLNEPIVIVFSEPMNRPSAQAALSVAPSPGTLTFSWVSTAAQDDTLVVGHPDFATVTVYVVTFAAGARDSSDPGNPLSAGVGVSFTTSANRPPQVTVTGPTGCVSGGFDQLVTWAMSDPESSASELVVYANYTSTDASGSIVGPVTGATSSTWRVPSGLNADDLEIVVTVFDPSGANRTATGPVLTADSTPPEVVATIPAPGTAGVLRTDPIAVTFNETMDRAATEAAVSFSPVVGALSFVWTNATVVIQHEPFRFNQTYVLTIDVGARDACSPGTPLAIPFTLEFSTEANDPPTVRIDAPVGITQLQPGSSVLVEWNMSDDVTPAAQLLVFVNYTSSSGNGAITQGLGITNVSWTVAALDASDVRIEVAVIDAGGLRGFAATGPFQVHPSAAPPVDFVVIGAIAVAAAAGVVVVIVLLSRRKPKPPEQAPPEVRPPPTSPPGTG